MVQHYGYVWLFSPLFAIYRLINVGRFARFRMQSLHLRNVSLRAHLWLISAECVMAALMVFADVPVVTLLGTLAGVQLFVLLVLLRASTHTWEYAKPTAIKQHLTDRELPTVSVLIPARDESDALQRCLDSLIRNDYPKLEIIVLDDCSIDKRTPEIIRGFAHDGVRFVKGAVPPEDWIAKNYGYEQLRHEASGDVLLFCGADTTFGERTIRGLVETMLDRKKEMLSILPNRPEGNPGWSLLQSMRYYWELCLPRRLFKRPPVLSTCWVIRRSLLESFGGFGSVAQSVSPEAHFARRAVAADVYTFLRSHEAIQVHTLKTVSEQFDTTIRLRYPQLHRRLELVAAATAFEFVFFVLPFVLLPASLFLPHSGAFLAVWAGCIAIIELLYFFVAVQTKLHRPGLAFLVAPLAFTADIFMLHLSMARYEFGEVNWKGRNVCVPVMRVEPHLPPLPK